MSKILVLGGSRYFGKRLVNLLLQEGCHEITVATRGLSEVEYDGTVQSIKLDRKDEEALKSAAAAGPWDIVYDNICYSPDDAFAAVRAFDGQVGRYILTSTLSVYDFSDQVITESDFDPYGYKLRMGKAADFSYGEGKRLAEAAFFEKADFPVCAMRIPIVLGPDDYTRRLHFHVERVMRGTPIGVPNPEAAMSLITSAEAASFLQWLGKSSLTGPVNACSDGSLSIGGIIGLIEEITGKQADIRTETEAENMSPFGISASWVMDHSKAQEAGYCFESVYDWLPHLIRDIAACVEG